MLAATLTRASLTVRGRDAVDALITICVNGKTCKLVGGSTRVFSLNGQAGNGGVADRESAVWDDYHRTPAAGHETGRLDAADDRDQSPKQRPPGDA